LTAISPHATVVTPDDHKFVRALAEPIEPVRVGVMYQFGLLLAAATMLVLPLIYLGVVAFVAYGLYYHATENLSMFDGVRGRNAGKFVVAAYLTPLIVGIVLLLFMIKPLFAKRGHVQTPTKLDRDDEPVLFAFVGRLCDVVGAPKPSRIQVDTQVNASASFREGLVGFLRKDLVLTIGLPLAAGLTMRQLAGVLAHEFGHFAQGTGMRLTFIVRSINNWFARVVYERDAWDEWLEGLSHDGGHAGITIVALVSRLFVWLTRRVLWVLMIIGHAVSSFMLRQMEFDADRYETRVAGSDAFAETSERIRMLSVASQAAFNDLQAAWQEKRLGDDLALLVRHRDITMPAEVRDAVLKHSSDETTGWFDTHPCDAARVASSKRENCSGLFRLDDPATDLFTDFCTLSRDVTVRFYQEELELPVNDTNLVSSSDLITSVDQQSEAQKSVTRFFQGLIHPVRPVFLSADKPDVRDKGAAAEMLLERRGQVVAAGRKAGPHLKAFKDADKKLVNVKRARAMLSAGVAVNFAEMELPRANYEGLRAVEQQAQGERDAVAARLNKVLNLQMQRLQIALALEAPAAKPPPLPPPAPSDPGDEMVDFGEYEMTDQPAGGDALRTALAALSRAASQVEELRQNWIVLAGLIEHLNPSGNNAEQLVNEVIARSRKVARSLSDVRDTLHSTPYPYPHVERGATLAGFVVKGIPEPENVGAMYQAGEMAIDAAYPLYTRILADLCSRAEAVEASLGLQPLPEPAATDPQ
jgi:Zn-dependent protease with chaperone function